MRLTESAATMGGMSSNGKGPVHRILVVDDERSIVDAVANTRTSRTWAAAGAVPAPRVKTVAVSRASHERLDVIIGDLR